jgi:hypothetical protein
MCITSKHCALLQAQLLKPLQPGRIMAQNFLRLGTMVEIAKEQPRPGMSALLAIVCKAEEFKNITLRRCGKGGRRRLGWLAKLLCVAFLLCSLLPTLG